MCSVKNHETDIFGNEQGMVLIVALVMLSLMTIIGVAATNTASTETMIAGVEKRNTRTFYSAEAGVEYAMALLESRFLAGNRAKMATNNLPDWDFALAPDSAAGVAASSYAGEGYPDSSGRTYTAGAPWLNDYAIDSASTVKVHVWNNQDGGSAVNDLDGRVWVRSDATGRDGSRSSVMVLMAGTMSSSTVSDYAAQEGGGSGKNYSSTDKNAITDFSKQL
jgi:hypothetical protein